MKTKVLPIFVGIFLFVSLFAAPSPARAWAITPQKVTFLNAQGVTLTGWLFKPAGTGPFPAVVMLHGCAGAYSYSDATKGVAFLYREWGDRLAGSGFVALLVDSFTPRQAAQNQCGLGGAALSEVHIRPLDAYAGLKYLASQSFVSANRVGLLGWSHGGSSAMATMDVTLIHPVYRFKAALAFYPGCGLRNAFGGLSKSTWKPYAPFAIMLGSADGVINPVTCQTRVSRAQALGATTTSVTSFSNVHHGFDLARQVSGGFTQTDVDAKKIADIQTVKFFTIYLR